jgi:four helix bundle protein
MFIAIHGFCNAVWTPPLASLIDQLRRSSLSVQLNIAEGHALRGARQFARHLTIAYGSAIEVVDLLELLDELLPGHEREADAGGASPTQLRARARPQTKYRPESSAIE